MSARHDKTVRPLSHWTDADLTSLRLDALAKWVGDGQWQDKATETALNHVNVELECRKFERIKYDY